MVLVAICGVNDQMKDIFLSIFSIIWDAVITGKNLAHCAIILTIYTILLQGQFSRKWDKDIGNNLTQCSRIKRLYFRIGESTG